LRRPDQLDLARRRGRARRLRQGAAVHRPQGGRRRLAAAARPRRAGLRGVRGDGRLDRQLPGGRQEARVRVRLQRRRLARDRRHLRLPLRLVHAADRGPPSRPLPGLADRVRLDRGPEPVQPAQGLDPGTDRRRRHHLQGLPLLGPRAVAQPEDPHRRFTDARCGGQQRVQRGNRLRARAVRAACRPGTVRRHCPSEVPGDAVTATHVPRHAQAPTRPVYTPPPPPKRRKRHGPRWLPGLLLVSPSLILIGIFVYGFLGWNVRVSFTNWRGLSPSYHSVGFDNYVNLFKDDRFRGDIRNLIVFTVVFVAGSMVLGFVMAMLLDKGVRGEGFFRGVYLFPMAISFIATAIIWRWLLD